MSSLFLRLLLPMMLIVGSASAQVNPPTVRLDLVIFRIDFGGDSSGIGLQWPRVGLEVHDIVGVAVGVPDPPPPPPPSATFAYLEGLLAERQAELATLLATNAPIAQIQTQLAVIEAIIAGKSAMAGQIV